MHVLIIDNYDSFTYNLVQLVFHAWSSEIPVTVRRNDTITTEMISDLHPSHIILSPGPGDPSESGISPDVVKVYHTKIPILGVCLGHQIIASCFGGTIVRAPDPIHGKTDLIEHDGTGCFHSLPSPLCAARYHSLVTTNNLHSDMLVNASCGNLVMGIRHKHHPIHGVQFHPESFLTQYGSHLMKNFLSF